MFNHILGDFHMKKVALVVASNGYQEQEYNDTKKVLELAEVNVVTISNSAGEAIGHDGSTLIVDGLLDDLQSANYNGLFVIGGPGAMECLNTSLMHRILSEFFALEKPFGAICISPRILANAQVARNKKAACWNGDGKALTSLVRGQMEYVEDRVVSDGLVVTASGPEAAEEFGKAIVAVI
jgi:protease I